MQGSSTGLSGLLGKTSDRILVQITKPSGPAKGTLTAEEFNAHDVPMAQAADVARGSSRHTLPTGGDPSILITSKLSGCRVAMGSDGGGALLVRHIQPAVRGIGSHGAQQTGLGAQIRSRFANVAGVLAKRGSQRETASVTGVRKAGRQTFYRQATGCGGQDVISRSRGLPRDGNGLRPESSGRLRRCPPRQWRPTMLRTLATAVLAGRFLLIVFFLGLLWGLALFAVRFLSKLWDLTTGLWEKSEPDMLIELLHLVDSALVASLVVMVALSSYDSLVDRLQREADQQELRWVSRTDHGNLKLKVATAMVAISSIHLLQVFLQAEQQDPQVIMWRIAIHLVFLVGAVLLGVIDRVAHHHGDAGRNERV